MSGRSDRVGMFRLAVAVAVAPASLNMTGLGASAVYSVTACSRRRDWISMYTLTSETAAGVTPGMLEAWARVRGFTLSSFSCISRERPLTER